MTDTSPAAPAADTTPATPADPAARDAELTALFERDPNTYQYAEGGRFANEHLALRKAQQSPGEQDGAEQAEDDDLDEDVSAIDLDAPVGEDVGEDGSETSVKPIGPGDDATDEELSAWRIEHGVPDDPTGYEPPTVDGIEWDQGALTPILEIAHEHNLPSKPVTDALAAYAERIKAQRAQIAQRDRENVKAVKSSLSDEEIAAVKTAAKAMPAELRTLLNQARAPDGSRIINNVEVLKMIAASYGNGPKGENAPALDGRAALQAELAELNAIRDRDVMELYRPWRDSGMSGSDRTLQIARELASEGPKKPSTSDLSAEERELAKLKDTDPQMYEFGNWRNTGRPPADRHYALRMGRG